MILLIIIACGRNNYNDVGIYGLETMAEKGDIKACQVLCEKYTSKFISNMNAEEENYYFEKANNYCNKTLQYKNDKIAIKNLSTLYGFKYMVAFDQKYFIDYLYYTFLSDDEVLINNFINTDSNILATIICRENNIKEYSKLTTKANDADINKILSFINYLITSYNNYIKTLSNTEDTTIIQRGDINNLISVIEEERNIFSKLKDILSELINLKYTTDIYDYNRKVDLLYYKGENFQNLIKIHNENIKSMYKIYNDIKGFEIKMYSNKYRLIEPIMTKFRNKVDYYVKRCSNPN